MSDKKECETEITKPVINDQYWFKYSGVITDDATKKRDDVASKLQEGIKWLWTIYTAAAAVGIALSKESYPLWTVIIIALPSFFLIVAYWLAAWVHLPIKSRFHPEIPEEIREVHTKWVNAKDCRLKAAFSVFVVAALFVSAAIVTAAMTRQAPEYSFAASSYMTEMGEEIIALSGRLPGETQIAISIEPAEVSVGAPVKKVEQSYLTPASGQLQQSIVLEYIAESYDVAVTWKGTDEITHSLIRTVPSNRAE